MSDKEQNNGLPGGAPEAAQAPAGPQQAPQQPAPVGPQKAPQQEPQGRPGGYGDRPRFGGPRPDGERRPWRPRDRQGGDEEGGEGGHGGRDRFKDGGRPRFGRFFRRKVCKFCTRKLSLSYRDADTLRRFITERGKILPRRITGTCPTHQRRLAVAIKQARVLALLPFVEK